MTFQKTVSTFHPQSADEAAKFVRLVNQHKQRTYITGFANNITPEGEAFADMVVLSTDRLNRLLEVDPEDFYVTVGAGYPLREINGDIRSDNLFLPHSALCYVGSVGGAVAVNLAAELAGHLLPIKKHLIMAEVVTPQGEIITPGSPCFKSVSGYDVVKIFTPSWGLLGLVVNATFRVLPISAAAEYTDMKMATIDRDRFLAGLDENSTEPDVIYSRKIKAHFDPEGVLPVV